MSTTDRESLRLNYELLFLRWQSTQSAVFAIFGFCIAVQGALFVGMLTLDLSGTTTLLLGLGLLMVSTTASLVVRFYELSGMLDRQMLEVLEDELGVPSHLRLRHGLRLEKRHDDVMTSAPLSDAQKRAARKRRTSKVDPGYLTPGGRRAEGPVWKRIDGLLTTAGQPTLVITAVLSLVGVAGVATAVGRASDSLVLLFLAGLLTASLLVAPFILATERGPVKRWRGTPM